VRTWRQRWNLLVGLVIFIPWLVAAVLFELGLRWLVWYFGPLGYAGIAIAVLALWVFGRYLYSRAAATALTRWAAGNGWSAVEGRTQWPWTASAEPGSTPPTVRRALTRNGLTVGAVRWETTAMLDAAGPASGRGFFAVLRLDRTYPRLGVRRKVDTKRPAADAYDRRYWTLCADADVAVRHIGPDLKAAHAAGRLPDWLIAGDELYVVVRRRLLLTPRSATALIRQISEIAHLLGVAQEGSSSVSA
jgi:hypothetical protein